MPCPRRGHADYEAADEEQRWKWSEDLKEKMKTAARTVFTPKTVAEANCLREYLRAAWRAYKTEDNSLEDMALWTASEVCDEAVMSEEGGRFCDLQARLDWLAARIEDDWHSEFLLPCVRSIMSDIDCLRETATVTQLKTSAEASEMQL
ncbi:MAG: hypothetical protein H6905_09630 [Hyphomicrobiales bacterium]|nr:hypothetical protein [Hyphomicrobiales bacterium]